MDQLRLVKLLKQQREKVQMEYRHREETLADENRQLVYPNQKAAVDKIISHFSNGKSAVTLVAQPGVGKTGVALELSYRVATHPDDNITVQTKDIHTHCGMNDKEWKAQYERNMLESFKENISHRSKIKQSIVKLSTLANGLIITDEAHIASGKRMSQSNALKAAGLLNIDNLVLKKNKLVNISATPESVMEDMKQWGDKAAIVILQPGPNYKGFQIMIDEQRIWDAPELTNEAEVETLLRLFETRYQGNTKRFFPFRGLTPDIIHHVYTVAIRMEWNVIHHDSYETIEDVDEFMSSPPEKHTAIFIKEYWCASKRLVRTHVGGSYEKPPIKQNTSRTSQALTARFCDNYVYEGDWLNPNLRPLHFCDLSAIEQYLIWYANGCDYTKSPYMSANLKSIDGRVKARESLLHPSNVDGLDETEDTIGTVAVANDYTLSQLFQNKTDAFAWANAAINWQGEWNTSNPPQTGTWNVNPCNTNGSPGNTHIRYGGTPHPIPTEAVFRRQGNFSKFGYGVRCVPIKTGDTLSYIIVYKASWLRA